ncbi:MAG TPA: 1-(5-phosphoribosyl)-5-[(5-phosphoribosylamino)methylideneamino]imidazole-4-carboxamide isomerase [Aequorivita sp.]|nr:1-(5-phosphoribosyl)-5-[(5-phosphoribosylamino)methylideneamino]imidazole-4-carboxamide isomerase [Aequorivita sp.]
MRIIPAIDIIDGKCVRLIKGDYATQKTYHENPLEVAKMFESHGIKHLHVVDLEGAKAKGIVNHKTLKSLASKTNLQIDFGGGIKSEKDIRIAFDCGAKQVNVGSMAVQNPKLMEKWLNQFGPGKIILGADCKNQKIVTNGWLKSSEVNVFSFIREYEKKGAQYAVVTDVAKDGMLSGPSFKLYEAILDNTNIHLIASGGITTIEDIIRLKELGCEGVVIGKAIYEGSIKLKELSSLC